jgi:predicted amidophosphoribosyltransferase
MTYKEGECFKCGKKIPLGNVCEECAKKHADEEEAEFRAEEDRQRNKEHYEDIPEEDEALAQERFEN